MYPEIIEFSEKIPVKAKVARVDEYPYHWHNAVEIIMVLEGRAEVTLCGETHLLKERDIAVVNVDEPHRIKKNSWDNRILSVQIDPDFCGRTISGFEDVIFYCCSTYHEVQAPRKYHLLKEHLARLVFLLEEENIPDYEFCVRRYLEELLVYMAGSFDYLRYGAGTRPIGERQVQRYRQIYHYIRQNPAVKNRLAELAEAAGITPQHMSSDIKEKFGITLKDLIYSGNCMQAVRLLLNTDKLISEISSECGFSDPKYMIKAFKRFYYCTPSEFRKKHKAGPGGAAARTLYQEFPLISVKKYEKFIQKS